MKRLVLGLLPLVLLAILVVTFLAVGPLGLFRSMLPPIQELAVERTVLKTDQILLHVLNDGPDPITVAQVMVNGAFWYFEMEPSHTISRLERGRITIPYPWVEGDTEHITLVTGDGVTFETSVEVATASPTPGGRYIATFALLGVYVGVIPVFLGLLWLPFLRGLSARQYGFILSLTIGLLVFLGVDALAEAIETAGKAPEAFQGISVIVIGFFVSILLITAVSQWSRQRKKESTDTGDGLTLAFLIAFGIGVHNLGEGLAIGGAYAIGEVVLGALLVLGFMIHNVTEGVAIVAPVAKTKPSLGSLGLMGLLAGCPTIFGTWIGGFSYSAIWAVLFLAVGAGAVFQVVFQVGKQMGRGSLQNLPTFTNVSGFLAGLLLMYVTGLFVAV